MRMDMRVQVPFKVVPSCKSAKEEVCSSCSLLISETNF